MARGDQLARQWRIIQTLISSKHGKTVGDLVKDENCHPRTIYRDLEALQEAGGQAKPYQMRQFLRLIESYNVKVEED